MGQSLVEAGSRREDKGGEARKAAFESGCAREFGYFEEVLGEVPHPKPAKAAKGVLVDALLGDKTPTGCPGSRVPIRKGLLGRAETDDVELSHPEFVEGRENRLGRAPDDEAEALAEKEGP